MPYEATGRGEPTVLVASTTTRDGVVAAIRCTVANVPELPEVESIRRQLAPELTGRRIEATWWDPHPSARRHDVARAEGMRVIDVTRRGKFLLCPLTAGAPHDDNRASGAIAAQPVLELVLHLGMTGALRIETSGVTGPHDRATLQLDDGRVLVFRDVRRFGRISVVDVGDYASTIPTLARLGPEPLEDEFAVEPFAAALRTSTAPVKALLLGQRVVAGVGNIYADEALWRAGIAPDSRHVGPRRAQRLHTAIRKVLTDAIDHEGTTFRDYQMVNGASGRHADHLDVYGKSGLPCRRCGTLLRRSIVAQRGTTSCPRCQRR